MRALTSKKSTLASRQKLAVILIAVAIVLLAVVLAFVNYIVSIDTFTDIDGTKYTVKRQGSTYALFDENGYMLDFVVEDNGTYYLTDIGTMVSVSAVGETSIYAVVDTEDGESVSDYNRLMIYPRIKPADIQTIRVKNAHGTFVFDRNNEGKIYIKNQSGSIFDEELFAYLQSVCGNTTVMQKISAGALEKYGFEEYGLDEPQATVTVTTSTGKKHVLHVGKPIVSGNGYYVRLEGRNAVYIINTYIGKTALVPIETYVSPILGYPVTTNNYMLVHNMVVSTHKYAEDGALTLSPDVALTYVDLADRNNTEYQTLPYKMTDPAMAAYTPAADAVTATMRPFVSMDSVTLVKLGPNADELAAYGLDKPAKSLYYELNIADENGKPYYIKNYIFVSPLTENNTYYATSEVYGSSDKQDYQLLAGYDQVVEVPRSFFPFMDWTSVDWVQSDYFQMNITICDELEFMTSDYHVTFDIVPQDTNNDGKADDILAYLVKSGDNKKLETNNFKTLYINLLGGKLFGSVDLSEEEIDAIIADESRHILTWKMRTSTTKIERTYSYYWLAESKALLVVDGHAEFYVLTSAVTKTAQDAIDVSKGIKITAVSPYTNIDQ